MAIFIGRRPEDQFTRVPNAWARDPKLTTKAKGMLTYLLSHQDGYQLSLKQVIAENADGRDAIYKTLGELVERGYLRRDQRRGERGKVGEVDYYVADSPQVTTASGFTASGESGSGDDQGKQDVSAGGTASWNAVSGVAVSGKPDTKKTRGLEDQFLEDEKTISLSARDDSAAPSPVELEPARERDGSTSSEVNRDKPTGTTGILLGAGLTPYEAVSFTAWADQLGGGPKGVGWYVTLHRNHTLQERIEEWREHAAASPTCPDCNDTGQTGDWMNLRTCDCLWWKDPGAARRAFIALLKDFPECDHGVAGGDQKAPNGWQYCGICRGPGWEDKDIQPRTEERGSAFRRSTSSQRAADILAIGADLDPQHGHGSYAPRQIRSPADRVVADAGPLYAKYKAQEAGKHQTFKNPPIEAYEGEL